MSTTPALPPTNWAAVTTQPETEDRKGKSRGELRAEETHKTPSPPDAPTKPPRPDSTGPTGGRKTRRATKNRGDIVVALMEIRDQIKVYHWQTSKYARHIATNDLVASLDTNIDQFVEVYMGKYGRPKIAKTIKLHNFSESAARAFVAKQTDFLTTKMPKMLKSTDSDLLNIRDTILADVNKTLYLFTLR